MNQNDLRYLLKEKYNFKESELLNIGKTIKSSNLNADLKKDLKDLESGTPIAYLIGYIDFLNLRINLNYKTLIPRPETEYWCSLYIEKLKNKNDHLDILDIFCGSGCIGLSIAKNLESAHVTLSDISDEATKQSKENLKINNINSAKCDIIKSDLFEKLKDKTFDYIFANPPYVENVYKKMGERGLKYEPSVALFGGEDGLDIIRKFLKEAPEYLNHNGIIIMEFGDNQETKIEEILYSYNLKNFEFFKDQFGVYRWVEIRN